MKGVNFMRNPKERIIECLISTLEKISAKEATPEEINALAGVARVLLDYLPESSSLEMAS